MNVMLKAVYGKDVGMLDKIKSKGAGLSAVIDGFSLLIHAINDPDSDASFVKWLIENGADVNYKENDGWTALHFAARDQNAEVVELLLKHGADNDVRDGYGNTALWRAVMACRVDMTTIKLLIENGADFNLANESEVSPLILAETAGKSDIIEYFKSNSEI